MGRLGDLAIDDIIRSQREILGEEIPASVFRVLRLLTLRNFTTLGDESKDIQESISFIKNVTKRTNMIALNAAIEAAKAGGESGKGFAIISDEIRRLSKEVEKGAEKIDEIINKLANLKERQNKIVFNAGKDVGRKLPLNNIDEFLKWIEDNKIGIPKVKVYKDKYIVQIL